MSFLCNFLERSGYEVFSNHRDGLENRAIQLFRSRIDEQSYDQICLFGFALEYYNLMKADACVGFLNGRVPDEATVIKMGIAFASGIPVVLYKIDSRILFPNGDNTMIQGLSGDFSTVTKLERLTREIQRKIKNYRKRKLGRMMDTRKWLSGYNLALFDLGQQISQILIESSLVPYDLDTWSDFTKIIEPVIEGLDTALLTNFRAHEDASSALDQNRQYGRVYCSGPLFCPAEMRQMRLISDILIEAGFTTYLPQQDGGEPYVIGSVGNPLAGSLISRPIVSFLNNVLFSLDVNEIVSCQYFVINLNGRTPDDGAMAEMGMAFAAGKPIVLYMDDLRAFSSKSVHPTVRTVAHLTPATSDVNELPGLILSSARALATFGDNKYSERIPLIIENFLSKGAKWSRRLEGRTPPENEMELWNQFDAD